MKIYDYNGKRIFVGTEYTKRAAGTDSRKAILRRNCRWRGSSSSVTAFRALRSVRVSLPITSCASFRGF